MGTIAGRQVLSEHVGKTDHFHRDGREFDYEFKNVAQLRKDFEAELRKMGVKI